MGVGDPARIVDAIGAGVDMFDCVLPTRLARHGTVLTSHGRVNLRNAKHARDKGPLDPANPMSRDFSRAYMRHLFQMKEPTAARIATIRPSRASSPSDRATILWFFPSINYGNLGLRYLT